MPAVKRPPGKHNPRGIAILHEDRDIIVVEKPCGLLTMGTDRDKSRTVHTILNEYVRKGDPRSKNRVYIVHRLDRDTSGILILAKSEAAKIYLQEHWQDTDKRYLTVVHGSLAIKTGVISSYLAENSAFRVYSTADPALGKLSRTEYTVLKEIKGFSLLEIRLLTGRKHQIRVHLAEKGHPVVGDRKYGKINESHGTLALHARSLSFTHPVNVKSAFRNWSAGRRIPCSKSWVKITGNSKSSSLLLISKARWHFSTTSPSRNSPARRTAAASPAPEKIGVLSCI